MRRIWRRTMRVEMAGLTDKGMVRESNEDYALIVSGRNAPRWAMAIAGVFDGVGGFAGGQEASSRVAKYFQDELHLASGPRNEDELSEEIKNALLVAHERLLKDGRQSPELQGMATTATVAIIARKMPTTLMLGQVGDGAAFLIREKQLTRLTHTDAVPVAPSRWGKSSPGVADRPGDQISQAIGCRAVDPHMASLAVRPGDYLVLGTDGLVNEIDADTIQLATCDRSPRAACQFLVDAANAAGGKDNIGVAAIRFG